MKKLILIIGLIATQILTAQEQPKVFNLDEKKPKTKEQVIGKSEKTIHTAIWKGQNYEVYKNNKGAMFIVIQNKNKNGYTKKMIK